MLKFGDSFWLQMIWVSIALFFVGIYLERRMITRLKKAFGKKAALYLSDTVSWTKKRMHWLLQALALMFFAIALARPLMGIRQQEVKQTGVEMIIALDISNSMLAEDDKPSRLEHAKHEIMNILDRLNGDRLGLIAFAGSAILVSPMTSDHGAIKLYLSALSTNSVSTQGTNFKDVLAEAVRAFDRGGVEGLNGTKPTRVLLIASDGEDNEHGAENQIKRAVDQGVRIFTLGFGTARGAPIPLRDERGNLKGYKKDRANQVVMSIPSDSVLAKLAKSGGGSYYHSTFDESEVKNLVADLDKLQKADFKTRLNTEYDEKFQIPLFIGLLISFLDLMFGTRKTTPRIWRGRFGVEQ
jgi:Ca-activated chloride channel family protein